MKWTISNGNRELILSSLRNQVDKLETLIRQLEDESHISYGIGMDCEDLLNVEYAIKMVRKILKKYEN